MYDVNYISKVAISYLEEAKKCYDNDCYIASLIMYGAALEAILLSLCFCYQDQARRAIKQLSLQKIIKNRLKRSGKKRGMLLELSFEDLIKIAEYLNWLPLKDRVDQDSLVEDYVRLVKEVRNLVHPARWLKPDPYFHEVHIFMKNSTREDIKKLCELLNEVVDVVRNLLVNKICENIQKQIKTPQSL